MNDEEKTKEQLVHELILLRRRIAELKGREYECKQVEQALRNSQERLNLALTSSKAGAWDRDIAADKATWDEQLHALFGLPPGSFSGRLENFLGMVHPDDQKRVREEMTAAMNGDADYSTTYRVIWPDSTVHYIVDRGKVYRDSAGRPVRMIGVNLDVTEMKQAEEALKESQQQLADIVDFLPDATFVIDRKGKVISWNRAIEEMTGIKAAEILGRGDYEYALPFYGERRPILIDLALQPHEEFEATYDMMERKESVLTGEAYVPALKRGQAYLFGTASILRDSKGNVVGAIESIRDISERKRAEEELGKYRDRLEDLVKERTAELTRANERLTREIEDRKVAQEALRESQQMLRLVMDTIPARVFWKDLDSNYLGCNRALAFDAGLESPEEIIGKNDFELVWAEYAELYRSGDHSALKAGHAKLGYEEHLTAPDGRRMWVRTNKVPIVDSAGRVRGVLGTYEDITDSKRMEQMLRESEAKYRIVAENTYDWEYWVNPDGSFQYTSPSCQNITGYPASEFQEDPKLLFHIIHPEDLAQVRAHLEPDFRERVSDTLEFRIIHRDGTTRWMAHVSQPIFDAQGRFLGRRGSNRDITGQKHMEAVLRESEERYRELVQNANSAIMRFRADGTITFFNEFAQKFFGWSAKDIVGKHASILVPKKESAGVDLSGLVQDVVASPERYLNHVNENICRDGRRVWMAWTNRAIRDEAGLVTEILAIGSDITDRKLMEEELRDARDALEVRVEERTTELERANKALRETEKQLRAIPARLLAVQEEERKRLARELHDSIGQTLAAIKYGIEVILEEKDRRDIGRAYELLEHFVPTLQRSIEETRAIYMGLRPSILDSLGVIATLDWFRREFERIYPRQHIELETKIEEEEIPEPLKIAVFRIAQESLNNIAKHSKAEWVDLALVKKGDAIELTIADDGVGIDLGTISQTNFLNGLGINNMRERAELTGGTFSIESTPGNGTSVRVVWPVGT